MSQALTGIRVIDMTHHQAGPSCTQMLAWLGAEVIKIEPPRTGDQWRHVLTEGADDDSFFFLLLNTNKQSLTLNLKHPEAKTIFTTLLSQADVFVENYGPGVMDRLGLSYEALRERHPRLIYASVKGFNVDGPYSTYKCFEEIAQAMSGAMSVTGCPEGPPMLSGVNVGEAGTGLHMALGILAALLQRHQTGRGQRVDVAMQEATLHFTRGKFTPTLTTGLPMPRLGNGAFEGGVALLVRCAPGGPNDYVYVMFPPQNQSMFESLARALDREELLHDPRFHTAKARAAHREALQAILEAWAQTRVKQDVMAALAGGGVACGAVLDTAEVLADAHLRHSGMVQDVEHPTRGRYPMIGCPVHLSDSPVQITPAPLLGEHTAQVLTALAGCTPEEIEHLRNAGAV